MKPEKMETDQMQSRPPSVADQTSFGSKHSDEDGDDHKEKEFVTVIKIGSETTQSEVPELSGIIDNQNGTSIL